MAKKKTAPATIEEKMEAALVPAEEQPYEVPGNWCWVYLGNIIDIKRGASPRPIKTYITEEESGVNWIKIGDTDEGKYIVSTKEKVTREGANKSVYVEKGTLLLSNSMSFGRPYILSVSGCIHDGWLALTPNAAINKEFLYYSLLASRWYFEQVAVGTAVRNLNSDRVARTPVVFPPLFEQRRIVDCIESMFAKLDEAKEKAQAVIDGYEERKAAILYRAFTGELTEKWRSDNKKLKSDWRNVQIKNVCCDVKVGIVITPSKYYTTPELGTPAFRSANVSEFFIEDKDWVFINEEGKQLNQRTIVHTGDVLIVRSGAPGTACVVTSDYDGYIAIDIIIAVPNQTEVYPDFLCAFTNAPQGRNMVASGKRGMGLEHFNVGSYSKLLLELPSIPEQREIVRILDDLLAKEATGKEAAEATLTTIDTMKQSILSRAFRGELGTNDPNDEPAEDLLKRILASA